LCDIYVAMYATLIKSVSSAFNKVVTIVVVRHLCEISSEFCEPKIIQISWFLTELFQEHKVEF